MGDATIVFRVPDDLEEKLNKIGNGEIYTNRSEFLRDAIRQYHLEEEDEDEWGFDKEKEKKRIFTADSVYF